jgi:hypothetical protein
VCTLIARRQSTARLRDAAAAWLTPLHRVRRRRRRRRRCRHGRGGAAGHPHHQALCLGEELPRQDQVCAAMHQCLMFVNGAVTRFFALQRSPLCALLTRVTRGVGGAHAGTLGASRTELFEETSTGTSNTSRSISFVSLCDMLFCVRGKGRWNASVLKRKKYIRLTHSKMCVNKGPFLQYPDLYNCGACPDMCCPWSRAGTRAARRCCRCAATCSPWRASSSSGTASPP